MKLIYEFQEIDACLVVVASWFLVLHITVAAVYRPCSVRLEWNLGFLTALGAGNFTHFPAEFVCTHLRFSPFFEFFITLTIFVRSSKVTIYFPISLPLKGFAKGAKKLSCPNLPVAWIAQKKEKE
ncbi:MAG: hypothetical protein NTW59_03860 [Candidatus Diapherotrites archaeon]|nr:hypothetical protein [Candidatus Diapherotrites archaeon]